MGQKLSEMSDQEGEEDLLEGDDRHLQHPRYSGDAGVGACRRADHGAAQPHTPFNDSGFPALAVPAGFSTSPPGLPLSMQLVGKPFDEETVYAAGYAYESQTRWYERKPSL
jgi:hypothetical protein